MKTTFAIWWRLLRPHQWIKNAFILVGLGFGRDWTNQHLILQVFGAIVAFSFLSSSVYIFNDIHDRQQDQKHPNKRHRPIASGAISLKTALGFALILGVASTGLGFWLSPMIGWILTAYIALNIGYNLYFKHMVIVDVFSIATGFMLRILAGTLGVGILPSQWLMLCGLMITLFLGFIKRRAEVIMLSHQPDLYRKVLHYYSPILLDKMITITAGGAILTYSLYAMSPETLRVHHTANLIYTVPFVIYGIFRYMYLLHQKSTYDVGDVAQVLMHDKHLLVTLLCWAALTLYLVV